MDWSKITAMQSGVSQEGGFCLITILVCFAMVSIHCDCHATVHLIYTIEMALSNSKNGLIWHKSNKILGQGTFFEHNSLVSH